MTLELTGVSSSALEGLILQHDVEQFLYLEARLLDERRLNEWLDLLADELHYWMPMRRNIKFGDWDLEFTRAEGAGLAVRAHDHQCRDSWSRRRRDPGQQQVLLLSEPAAGRGQPFRRTTRGHFAAAFRNGVQDCEAEDHHRPERDVAQSGEYILLEN